VTARQYIKRLRSKGLVVREGKGDHLVVMDPEGRRVLGHIGFRGSINGKRNRAHQNLRAQIRRKTGIDIDE
jgi:hypothetical protein